MNEKRKTPARKRIPANMTFAPEFLLALKRAAEADNRKPSNWIETTLVPILKEGGYFPKAA